MAGYSSLSLIERYIVTFGGRNRDKLAEELKDSSVDYRYRLLMNARGTLEIDNTTYTVLHSAVSSIDLTIIEYMLTGFSANQKYDVLKTQFSFERTALHTAARYSGHISILKYLLSNLSQQQTYDLLKIQDENGETPLHLAASYKRVSRIYTLIFNKLHFVRDAVQNS